MAKAKITEFEESSRQNDSEKKRLEKMHEELSQVVVELKNVRIFMYFFVKMRKKFLGINGQTHPKRAGETPRAESRSGLETRGQASTVRGTGDRMLRPKEEARQYKAVGKRTGREDEAD